MSTISRNSIVLAISTIKQSNYKGSDAVMVIAALREFGDALKQIDELAAQAKNKREEQPAPVLSQGPSANDKSKKKGKKA